MTQLGFWTEAVAPVRQEVETDEVRNPVRSEMSRRAKSRAAVLARLQRGTAYNYQLVRCAGLRAVGRVPELRKEGWVIEAKRMNRGVWRYTLKGRK